MGDIAAFPTIRNALVSGSNLFKMTATTALKAGMVVEIDASGVSNAVNAAVGEVGAWCIGVCVSDTAAGAEATIAGPGCIVYVCDADDTTGLDAGDLVCANKNAVGGTVFTMTAVGNDTKPQEAIGIMLEDVTASASGGIGKMLIQPMSYTAHG